MGLVRLRRPRDWGLPRLRRSSTTGRTCGSCNRRLAISRIFAAVELSAWIDRWPVAVRPLRAACDRDGVTAHALWVTRSMDTFKLADQLRRVSVSPTSSTKMCPRGGDRAGEQSGSMRYYTDRPIVRWEAATPDSLTAAMATLETSRRPVYSCSTRGRTDCSGRSSRRCRPARSTGRRSSTPARRTARGCGS
jgi:hypothetical protein